MGENKMIKLLGILSEILSENDPKIGTGKKPKGSGRRLYTDEDPKDTVSIKFKTKEDIVNTLNKKSFKSKPHNRQSQIINVIHQRVRAAYNKAKDPEVKSRLKRALDYIEKRKETSKEKTQRLKNLKELVTATEVICDNCGWEWKISQGGKDPYLCHKCDYDNTPKQLNEKCWKGYTQKGMKTMFGKKYPNCVKK
jgi:DNA-binding transcriptional MerR regulator